MVWRHCLEEFRAKKEADVETALIGRRRLKAAGCHGKDCGREVSRRPWECRQQAGHALQRRLEELVAFDLKGSGGISQMKQKRKAFLREGTAHAGPPS